MSTTIAAFLLAASVQTGSAKPGDPLDAPPAGLVPTSEHLSEILAAHVRAVGTPVGPDTVIEDWRFTDSGMTGTEHLERAGMDYHSRIVSGPFVEEYGQSNGKRWHRDYDGFVTPTTTTDNLTFFAERVNEDAADPKNDASVAGVTQGGNPAYVVRVKRQEDRHPEWIFYDVATGLIRRVEWVTGDDRRIVSLYDDFRTAGGLTTAWHVHDDWDPRQLDDDYVRTAMQVGAAVDRAQFLQPSSTPRNPPSSVELRIPAQMYDDGTIIMRMTVNGRGLDMLLDTAVNENVIDERVAEQLGLPTYGHVDRGDADVMFPFETSIPASTIGPLAETNVAIRAEPFNFQWSRHIEVVGVLGYDFLANNVLKIDYYAAAIDVMPVSEFDAQDPVPGGISYPLDLDDGLPFLALRVGNVTSTDVLLANEIDHSEFFGSFVEAHSDVFPKPATAARQSDELPFADNGSFGRRIERWRAQPSDVHFGAVDFQQPLVRASTYPLYLSQDRPVDGAIGFDFLRFFDVYLDYPHDRLIVAPNHYLLQLQHHA